MTPNPAPFEHPIAARRAALSALVAALDDLSGHAPAWRAERAHREGHELRQLLGRLRDTDAQDWATGSAASWLSPLDVATLRSGLLTACYRAANRASVLTPPQADALEALADALQAYIEEPPRSAR